MSNYKTDWRDTLRHFSNLAFVGSYLFFERGSEDEPLKLSGGDSVPIGEGLFATFPVDPANPTTFIAKFDALEHDLVPIWDPRLGDSVSETFVVPSGPTSEGGFKLKLGRDGCQVVLDCFFRFNILG